MSTFDEIKARLLQDRNPSRVILEQAYPHPVDAARWNTVFEWNEDLAAEGGYVMTGDAALWLTENAELGSYVVQGSTVLFENANDAFAFKLRWADVLIRQYNRVFDRILSLFNERILFYGQDQFF